MSTATDASPRVLGLIHTVASLVETFDALVGELGGPKGIVARHIVDEALLSRTRELGLTKQTTRHLLDYAVAAEESGAEAVLVTCSSVGPAVELVAPLVDVPVLRVDTAMVEAALELGTRIGVAATLESTLTPTVDLVRSLAERRGASAQLEVRLCAGAFDAARRGDRASHDAQVRAELEALAPLVDVIVLAQASMARALDSQSPAELGVRVLSSPRSAVARAVEVMASGA